MLGVDPGDTRRGLDVLALVGVGFEPACSLVGPVCAACYGRCRTQSISPNAYNNILWVAGLRFPANGDEFNAAAQANGTNR